jgi:hypothetical protein
MPTRVAMPQTTEKNQKQNNKKIYMFKKNMKKKKKKKTLKKCVQVSCGSERALGQGYGRVCI